MADTYTLARPYAEAVFERAQADGDFDRWSNALAALSAIVANPDVSNLMSNPRISDHELAEAIIGVGGDDLDGERANFVRLLVDNGRLSTVPAIAELYENRRAAAENRVDVSVTSAVELSQSQQQALSSALEQRLSRRISLAFEHDESIIGGLVIRAGDMVIDGSLAAQLERMRQSLSH